MVTDSCDTQKQTFSFCRRKEKQKEKKKNVNLILVCNFLEKQNKSPFCSLEINKKKKTMKNPRTSFILIVLSIVLPTLPSAISELRTYLIEL